MGDSFATFAERVTNGHASFGACPAVAISKALNDFVVDQTYTMSDGVMPIGVFFGDATPSLNWLVRASNQGCSRP